MDNKKIASQVIRALHKPTASAGGGGGEVWRELDFTEGEILNGGDFTLVSYQVAEATGNDYLRATITLVDDNANSTFRTDAFVKNGSFCVVATFDDISYGSLRLDDGQLSIAVNKKITENQTFKLEKIEILEQ